MVSKSNFFNFFQSIWELKDPNPKQTNKKSFWKKEFNLFFFFDNHEHNDMF